MTTQSYTCTSGEGQELLHGNIQQESMHWKTSTNPESPTCEIKKKPLRFFFQGGLLRLKMMTAWWLQQRNSLVEVEDDGSWGSIQELPNSRLVSPFLWLLVRVSRVFCIFLSVSLESALLSNDFLLAKIVGFDAWLLNRSWWTCPTPFVFKARILLESSVLGL